MCSTVTVCTMCSGIMKIYTVIACTTFGLAIAIVNCRSINRRPAVAQRQNDNPPWNDNGNKTNDVVTGEEGKGLFRNPLEIFGLGFSRSCTVNLCETHVLMRADNVVHDVRFTRRGARLCEGVCTRYRENMTKNRATVDVHSWPGYCDFIGTADGPDSGGGGDGDMDQLSTACTCAYKVRCDRRTELVLYSFEADANGNVRVSVTGSDRRRYVTAYLLSVYLLQEPTDRRRWPRRDAAVA